MTKNTATTSGFAIASLILGLLFFVPLGFLLAIIFGFIALSRIKDSNGALKGKGLAITGLVLGFSWILLIPIMGLLAAMAIPAFQKVRETSLEKMMHNNARQISSAAEQYRLETGAQIVEFEDLDEYFTAPIPFNDTFKVGNDTTIEVEGSFELIEPMMNRLYIFSSDAQVIEVRELSE